MADRMTIFWIFDTPPPLTAEESFACSKSERNKCLFPRACQAGNDEVGKEA